MKKSITYLPSVNQRDLHFLVECILIRVKQTEMIILFGSYASNNYVVYDEKFEFGKLQFYVSDYDILVITSVISDGIALKAFNNIEDLYYDRADDPDIVVSKEDIDALVPKVELLRDITKQICEVKIKEYGSGNDFIICGLN